MQQQQQPANTSGTPVIVFVQTAPTNTHSRYISATSKTAREFFWFGVAHAVIGVLCIIFQIVIAETMPIYYWAPSLSVIRHGFWTGSLFVVTGVVGIIAGKTGGKYEVFTFHILSTMSVVFAVCLLCIAATSVAYVALADDNYVSMNERIVLTVMETYLAAMGIAEGFVAICSSVIGCTIGVCCCKCGGSCCCPTDSQYQQLHDTVQPDSQQHSFAISHQEPTLNSNQQDSAVLDQNPQQLIFNLSQQQLILSPNQQQLIFMSTQPNVGFYPQHQAVQYYALLPVTAFGSHQTDASTILSGATGQGQDTGPLTEPKATLLPCDNTGTSRGNGSDKGPTSSDDVEMLSP